MADQQAVVRFLSDPASYEADVGTVERIDTHGAMVFLAGERAYKIKRAVHFPYMDFSTLEKRRQACLRELARNRAAAPGLYLNVAPILAGPAGRLRFGDGEHAAGEAVEWALVMRRFDETRQFDRLAERGELSLDLARGLADAVADFHDRAERLTAALPASAFAKTLAWVIDENASEFAAAPDYFDADATHALGEASRRALRALDGVLRERHASGLVRACHGDLHLANVCLWQDRATLFDAIEFNDDFIQIDVFYDLAYLLMDLEHRGLRRHANIVLNRTLQRNADYGGLATLPLFLSLRAAVRAKVSVSIAAVQADAAARETYLDAAQRYFSAAAAYLRPAPARLVAVGGLSGTGKSVLARRLAPLLGAPPGAVHLRTDAIRKAMFGVDETTRLPQSAYDSAVSNAVYARMLAAGRTALRAGHSVVMDGVFNREDGRAEVARLAAAEGVAFQGLWLDASTPTLVARVNARQGDASDATAAVVLRQNRARHGKIDWRRISTERPRGEVADEAAEILAVAGPALSQSAN